MNKRLVLILMGVLIVIAIARHLARPFRRARTPEAVPEPKPPRDDSAAAAPPRPPELETQLLNFRGLLTALQQAAVDELPTEKRQRILKNCERRINYSDSEALKESWCRLLQEIFGASVTTFASLMPVPEGDAIRLAKALLEQLTAWGVRQDDSTHIVITGDTLQAYTIYESDYELEIQARIVSGCWYLGDLVLEKGLATIRPE